MKLEKEDAVKLVLNHFDDTHLIYDEDTIETDYGWIFHVNSKEYRRTGDIGDRYLGIGPVIVEKHDGSIHILGTRFDRETTIKMYEVERRKNLPTWIKVVIFNLYIIKIWYRRRKERLRYNRQK